LIDAVHSCNVYKFSYVLDYRTVNGCVGGFGGFGSVYSASRGGGPVKSTGFASRTAGPYGGLYLTCQFSKRIIIKSKGSRTGN